MALKVPPSKTITAVLTAGEEKRKEYIDELTAEFQSSSIWLQNIIESCKRKILETSGLERDAKKARVLGNCLNTIYEKENNHPNEVVAEVDGGNMKEIETSTVLKEEQQDREEIDVWSMKVADLRRELKARDLDTCGLKKDLQCRLAAAMHANNSASTKIDKVEGDGLDGTVTNVVSIGDAATHQGTAIIQEDTDCAKTAENHVQSLAYGTEFEKMEMLNEVHIVDGSTKCSSLSAKQTDTNSYLGQSIVDLKDKPQGVTKNSDNNMDARYDLSTEIAETEMADESMVEACIANNNQSSSSSDITGASTSSAKKVHLGMKILKATSKLFSPSKKTAKSPMKVEKALMLKPECTNESDFVINQEAVIHTHVVNQTDHDLGITANPGPAKLLGQTCERLGMETSSRSIDCNLIEQSFTSAINFDGQSQVCTAADTRTFEEKRETSRPEMSAIDEAPTITVVGAISNPVIPSKQSSTETSAANAFALSASSQTIKEKQIALANARKARLAEIRGKSKPAARSTASEASVKKVDALSVSKLPIQSNATVVKTEAFIAKQTKKTAVADMDEMKKNLAAQMREKASRKQAESAQKLITLPINSSAQSKIGQEETQTKKTIPNKNSLHKQSPVKNQLKQRSPRIRSPMETYEISDREESEDETDSDCEKSPAKNKKIPSWAQRSNLIPALERQFMDGPDRVDPDNIFSAVSTCSLSDIFNQTKKRYATRTSSGIWTNDQVTIQEQFVYKRAMGFEK